jgi:putative ABC transport system permease protein
MPKRIRALDRKLLRDLWGMKGQALAIAAVMAAGITMFVTYFSAFDSLQRSRTAFYESARFADVFASAKRAPARLERDIAAIPGVSAVSTRVVASVTLDVPGMADPATGQLVSIPEGERPLLNDVYLRRGRWIDESRPDEVLASEMFCEEHGFNPGDTVAAIINGRRRDLTIVGIALSPEYVYAIRPGEMVPDARRYGIFWMGRRGLAAAFNMEGGFNDVSLRLARGVSQDDVIASLDRLLEPYGGRGAIPQSLQLSAWTLDNELRQLETFGFIMPLIFLGVSAFILHVALSRALALQRGQIAALKAVGYSNRELAWHYIKLALIIAAGGSLAGLAAGAWLGTTILTLYNEFFRFPVLSYQLSMALAFESLAGSLVVAAAGAQSAVHRAVRIPPAEAMRPEPPARYRRSIFELRWRPIRMGFTGRMVMRNIERQPVRTLISLIGIAFAVGVLLVGLSFIDVMDALINEQFGQSMVQDATLTFVEPRSERVVYDVAHLPGVIDVEPMRVVPVRLSAGTRSRTLAITALPEQAHLNRIVDRVRGTLSVPPDGLVLSRMLAEILGVSPGESLLVEVLEGRRVSRDIPVVGLVDDTLGLQAYMRLEAAGRLLGEAPTVSAVAVTLDPSETELFKADVKEVPAIAGVALKDVMLQNFRDTMAQNMTLSVSINVVFAAIIAFGVVYNSARVSLSERSRELASLRVLGFTRAEIAFILFGELGILTVLALPVGTLIGYLFGLMIMSGFNNEIYRLSFVVTRATVAWSWLTVIGAAVVSGLAVRRRLDRLDLVGVLKTRE